MLDVLISMLTLPVIILFVVIIIILTGIFVVREQEVGIVERLGKFHRIALPGVHVKLPIIDHLVSKQTMRTMSKDFDIDAKTQDNVTIKMHVSVQFHIDQMLGSGPRDKNSGVFRAYYMLANPSQQLQAFLSDALRSAIPQYSLDEVFARKDDIAIDVNNTVTEKMVTYGFVIVQTLITEIALPREVEDSMNQINAAQRTKAAAQDLAEADKIRKVTEAEAEAEAAKKQGEGIAAQRLAIASGIKDSLDVIQGSGVSSDEANLLFMYTQWTEMMTEFAKRDGGVSTVVLPSGFDSSASMFDQMLSADVATQRTPRPQAQPSTHQRQRQQIAQSQQAARGQQR